MPRDRDESPETESSRRKNRSRETAEQSRSRMRQRTRTEDIEDEDEKDYVSRGKTKSVIDTQPGSSNKIEVNVDHIWQFENKWTINLCRVTSKCSRCCYAFLCFPCFVCKLFGRVNESCVLCFVPFSLMSIRTKIRTAYRINGNLCSDCCATTFCPICSAIQLDAELDAHTASKTPN